MEHLAAVAPAWAVGVELAEINRHGKTKCHFCNLPVPKGDVRLKYWVSKSAMKFIHLECCNQIPVARGLHSKACLRFQREYGLGVHADGPTLQYAIDKALTLLP